MLWISIIYLWENRKNIINFPLFFFGLWRYKCSNKWLLCPSRGLGICVTRLPGYLVTPKIFVKNLHKILKIFDKFNFWKMRSRIYMLRLWPFNAPSSENSIFKLSKAYFLFLCITILSFLWVCKFGPADDIPSWFKNLF